MTDKEILAELKVAYENISDIRENGCIDHCDGQLDYSNIERLNRIKEDLIDLYWNIYREIDNEELRIDIWRNGKPYYCGFISDDISYDYMSYDENGERDYTTCEELEIYWYEDRGFLKNRS